MKEYTWGNVWRAGVVGGVLGGAAGFMLGLLLAPEEGKKMRLRAIYQLEHLAEQTKTLVDQVFTQQSGSEARRAGDALVADAQLRARQIRDDIDELLGTMRRQAPR